ncbi:MAG TPA: Nif3-like dinuclear metal center hexameric protein [Polyangiaceae bacterium]|jgi:dinuclear metal center YbgI/SA1388 family protein|nr:Nif3-like dinuclear metal center hexameric protein [Polyangiaceae bacterium]
MNVGDLVRAMEGIAPSRFAASWDNVGLLVGDRASPLRSVLLTIDCTAPVLDEARGGKASAVVAYHPPLFAPQKRFLAGSIAHDAARAGIAVYSPHTALDVAAGGTNDVIADAVGLTARAPLRPLDPVEAAVKLVTFVPAEHLAKVSGAVFAAGAGRIGDYSSCGFRTPGTGTFFGEAGAAPVIGEAGRLEEAAELRFETVVPLPLVPEVVSALRASHPYEEPAFDLVRLAPAPASAGMGRVGNVHQGPVASIVDAVKRGLGLDHVLVAGLVERNVSRVAVCAGSGGDLIDDAVASGAEVFLTGELRHHDALRATAAGLTVICTLHSASERAALVALEHRLSAELPGVTVTRSRLDHEPFAFR